MGQNEDTKVTDVTKRLMTLSNRILQAEEAGLKDELATLLHEDFTIIRASGVKQDREAFLDAVPDNANRGRVAEEPEVRVYDACAVVTLRVRTSEQQEGV